MLGQGARRPRSAFMARSSLISTPSKPMARRITRLMTSCESVAGWRGSSAS
jgi:hypothetical protein